MKIFSNFHALYEQRGITNFKENMQLSVNMITDVIDRFPTKYILFHFALYLTGTVNIWGVIIPSVYSPMHRHFLTNFLKSLFPSECVRYLQQIFERCVESENPLKSRISDLFCLQDQEIGVDYLKFVRHMIQNEEEFKDFSSSVDVRPKFGTLGEDKYPDHKDSLNDKKIILNDSMAIIEYSEEDLRAQFELVSKDCEKGKHCIIAVSGFLSENDDNVDAWKGLVQGSSKHCDGESKSFSMVPVYAYRWASKGVLSLLSPVSKLATPQLSFKGVLNKLLSLYQVYEIAKDYRTIFTHSIKIAKLSGKLLAHALILQFPFVNQSITVVLSVILSPIKHSFNIKILAVVILPTNSNI